MDMDLDLDELDGPNQAPSRSTRFAPKNSKFKPKPKTRPLKPKFDTSFVLPSTKEESVESLIASVDAGNTIKVEMESSCKTTSNRDDIVKMDTDLKTKGNQQEDLMEEDHRKDEDPVVREIDVFFTPSLDSNSLLYVLQYPLKPCWRPYELDEQCEEVRVKPASSEVEIDLSVDLDSKNYDPDLNTKGKMTKQVLSSSWKFPCRSGYAVGVLKGNKLHLNPVHAAVQLRPSLHHFGSGALRKKNMVHYDEGAVKDEKLVGTSKKQNKQTEVLNDTMKDLGENWIHLKYHGSKSNASTKYLQKMVGEEGSEIEFSMSSFDYVNSFCPGASNRQGGPSKRDLFKLSLEDRLKTWLCQVAPIHRFDVLKYLLAPSDSVEDLLEVLKKLCYLVQGLWVPKSSLLELQGLDALVRDYTLFLFSKSHCISKSDLPQKSKLKNAMENVLRVFAVQRSALRDWKFKEPKDMSFVQLHPDIVMEQEQVWETRGEKLNTQIYGERSGHGLKNPSKTDRTGRLVSMENASKGLLKTSTKTPAKTFISDETREALLKTLQKLFQGNKVCSFQRICQLLRDVAISKDVHAKGGALERSAAAGLDAPPEELRAIINQVAIDIHGVYVPRTPTDHSYDGLRKAVIDLLLVEGPNAKLKKANIIEAAKIALKRDEIPMAEYNKVMSELCVSRGSVWVLKSGDRSPDDKMHS
ncbi:Transcription regulator [Heracleum sosnowskyi]|uniref:Transcription regulator n=1 Tax=Heracleum sosnowskyi TaxID=360622 RepID=A0AAD8HEI0_9APIA|nr:Transcription regulator [Heracleum sosnowskyi]